VVLMDAGGESIGQVIREGRPEKGMPAIAMTSEQTTAVVAFLHSLPIGGRDPSRMRPVSIVVGNASAGEQYFKQTCSSCHSVTGDLRGLAARYPDARQLQHTWLMPGSGRAGGRGQPQVNRYPPSVRVTLPSGEIVEGTLNRIDDFIVSLTEASGHNRTFRRRGATPAVDVRDPLESHRQLAPQYRDEDIHNLTAYLVTLK
jgi:cytochrome c oxidase cbb3-type subunit III